MTSNKNSRRRRAGTRATSTASQHAVESQSDLQHRLRRMADEVEQLQTEIAAVEALVVVPEPVPAQAPVRAQGPAQEPAQRPVQRPMQRSVQRSAQRPVQRSVPHPPARPGAGWIPTPTPQPWLEARSA